MTDELPTAVKNGLPSEGHERLDNMVGNWNVTKSFYVMGGTPGSPITSSDLKCRKEWISETGNRHLKDITQGTIGGPYYRLCIISYSNMDRRYEWNTVDGLNTNMMTCKGEVGSGPSDVIEVSGVFTDQGILGTEYVGKTIMQRVVITIESADRHTISMYFTPPGHKERLADFSEYTRA